MVRMSEEERSEYRNNCMLVIDYLWPFYSVGFLKIIHIVSHEIGRMVIDVTDVKPLHSLNPFKVVIPRSFIRVREPSPDPLLPPF